MYEKIIVVTKRTALQELSDQFGTLAQAKFYLKQEAARAADAAAPSFEMYEQRDSRYQRAADLLRGALPKSVRVQYVDSAFLPQFTFGERDLVIALGPDGLVVNIAKYLSEQPLIAINPDPSTIEGVLLPFSVHNAGATIATVLRGQHLIRPLTTAEARLADGQVLRAVNDLFIGAKTHVSARYRLCLGETIEDQSSSGIIVSTGTGSTGWMRSILTGAYALSGTPAPEDFRFSPSDDSLRFFVCEPWPSTTTGASLVTGALGPGDTLEITSQMPQNGVIFSDGVEADYLPFNSGAIASIGISQHRVQLVVESYGGGTVLR